MFSGNQESCIEEYTLRFFFIICFDKTKVFDLFLLYCSAKLIVAPQMQGHSKSTHAS